MKLYYASIRKHYFSNLYMSKWEKIWNKSDRINKIVLDCLVKADGFAGSSRAYKTNDWIEYCENIYSKIGISKEDRIFEIGCGSGAFLYPLYLKNISVGGNDFSKSLLNLAKNFMPESDFICKDAVNSNLNSSYEIVVSHSVFQYLNDLSGAEIVIKKMSQMTIKKFAILDVSDMSKRDLFLSERMKNYMKEGYTEADFKKRYEGLDHLFYSKEWFRELGSQLNLKIEIFDQVNKNYEKSILGFNVIFTKFN